MPTPKLILDLESFYGISINEKKSDPEFLGNYYKADSKGNILVLSLINSNISNIDPIRKLKNLQKLILSNNHITDLTALSNLKELRFLDVCSNNLRDISPLIKLTNIEELSLEHNSLTDISYVDNLNNLKSLDLSFNQIVDIKPLSKLTDLRSLNLSGNQIVEFFHIKELKVLGSLAISDSSITNLAFLKDLLEIRNLQLSGNKIDDLFELTKLKGLRHLNLGFNKITDISHLCKLQDLKTIDVSNNHIYDLSPFISLMKKDLTQEKKFHLENNPWLNPSIEIVSMGVDAILEWFEESLQFPKRLIQENIDSQKDYLDLGRCNLTDLSLIPELFMCTHLKTLILSNEWGNLSQGDFKREMSRNNGPNNNIFNIPTDIETLLNLETLVCGGDWKLKTEKGVIWNRWRIYTLTGIYKLKNLITLNLSNNKIQIIYEMQKLKKLKILYLNNNDIDLSFRLPSMPNLEELYLSNNRIWKIDFLLDLPNIRTIDLHSNKITSLLPIKRRIENLPVLDSKWEANGLCIANNPLSVPRYEVISQGNSNIIAYLKQYEAESAIKLKPFVNNDIKLILVGNSNTGKSTLSHWLRYEKVKSDIPSTHWIHIDKWDTIYDGKNYNIRIFDFGGQEYYHDTHHLFFSSQTAYVILWTEDSDNFKETEIDQLKNSGKTERVNIQNYPLNYWLDSIQYHTKRKNLSEIERKITKTLDERGVEISSSITKGTSLLSFQIESTRSTGNELSIPSNILIVQNKVDKAQDLRFVNQRLLSEDYPGIFDFASLSVTHGRRNAAFKEILFEMLRTTSIIDQEFLGTWGYIKNHIEENADTYSKELSIDEFQQFCNELIRKIPRLRKRSKHKVEQILFNEIDTISFAKYLNDIGLILFFPENNKLSQKVFINQTQILKYIYDILEGLDGSNGEFDFLNVTNILKEISKDECVNILDLMIHFKIIFKHPSQEQSFIAPLYLPKKPTKSISFFLSLFKEPRLKFEFKAYISKNIILEFFQEFGGLALQDNAAQDFYLYWREGIIIKDKSTEENIMVRFSQMCDDSQNASIDVYTLDDKKLSPFLDRISDSLVTICKDSSVVKKVTIDGENYIPIDIIHKAEDTANWLFMYEDKYYNLTDFKLYLKNKLQMKRVFISYSKTDTNHLLELEKHLSVLKRTGKISTWNCRKLLPGEKWDGKIKKELEEADIILFLVSADFLATDYIWDIEIKRAIERENIENGRVKVVPIIVRSCFWEESPLGVYTATPGKAQIISSSKDIDVAWTDVVKQLKLIL